MYNFRNMVYEVIRKCCDDVGELNIEHINYGDITLKELNIGSIDLLCIGNKLSTATGIPITNEISNKWITISDIENTLSDFFK